MQFSHFTPLEVRAELTTWYLLRLSFIIHREFTIFTFICVLASAIM